jgi:hypothetical protein
MTPSSRRRSRLRPGDPPPSALCSKPALAGRSGRCYTDPVGLRSSAGQSTGFLNLGSQVRALPGTPPDLAHVHSHNSHSYFVEAGRLNGTLAEENRALALEHLPAVLAHAPSIGYSPNSKMDEPPLGRELLNQIEIVPVGG